MWYSLVISEVFHCQLEIQQLLLARENWIKNKKEDVKRKNVVVRQRYFQHASQEHGGDPAEHMLLTEEAGTGGKAKG